jgi:pyruvate formate lyase activating enzyme
MGRRMTVDEVMGIIERDEVFYRRSGGGVTFSGGEPLAQPIFLRHLLERCKALGINTALETCGYFRWRTGRDILKEADLVFLDIKHIDPAVHTKITGVSNELILRNAVNISEAGIPLIIRIPVVPLLNDSSENIRATAEFVAHNLAGVIGIELMPYHNLGKTKYAGLGLRYELDHLQAPRKETLAALREIIAQTGVPNLMSAQSWGIQPDSPRGLWSASQFGSADI